MKKQLKNKDLSKSRGIFKSISTKLSSVLLIAIVLVFSATGWLIHSSTKEQMVKDIEASLATKSSAVSDQVDAMFAEKATIVKQMAANQDMIDLVKSVQPTDDVMSNTHFKSVMKSLENVARTDQSLVTVWVAGNSANFILGNNHLAEGNYDIKSLPWYEEALSQTDVFFTEPYYDDITEKTVLTAALPIHDQGEIKGFVGVDLLLDQLPQLMQSYNLEENVYTFLLSKDGTVLYHPDEELILNQKLPDIEGDLGQIGSAMVEGDIGLRLSWVNDRSEYIGYSQVPTADWSVGAAIPAEDALSGLDSITINMVVYFVVACALLILIVYVLTRHMLKPIPKMMSVLKQLASGDLTPRLHIQSKDEM
ncbi:HAMP domain-containing protein, partial [Bacillaceae bacterium SIJ1]|uniref:PDC sensor domain-containing protein n=1 Tax=Litoribacterium kuwaitense TaxID=1398745 RepID=UPI0013ED8271